MHSDVDGRVGQDLPIAVPAAVGGGTAASRMISADLAEDLAFATLPQIQLQVRVALAVTWCEAEAPYPVDLDEGQVKLVVFAGVSEEVSEEVEAGTLSDQDEVGGAVSQVSSRGKTFGAARTSAAHAGSVDSQELPSDCPPLATLTV